MPDFLLVFALRFQAFVKAASTACPSPKFFYK